MNRYKTISTIFTVVWVLVTFALVGALFMTPARTVCGVAGGCWTLHAQWLQNFVSVWLFALSPITLTLKLLNWRKKHSNVMQ